MKCWACNKKAIGRFTPDLDIRGVGFCKEHKDEIFIALFAGKNSELLKELKDKYAKKIKHKKNIQSS